MNLQYKISKNGIRYWQQAGRASALVFLHGLCDCADMWMPTISEMRLNNNIIAPDLPGHGGSAWSLQNEYTIENISSIIADFLLEIGVKKCILIGHSLGSVLCTEIFRQNKIEIAALALIEYNSSVACNIIEILKLHFSHILNIESGIQYWKSCFTNKEKCSVELNEEFLKRSFLVCSKDDIYKLSCDPNVVGLVQNISNYLEKFRNENIWSHPSRDKNKCPVFIISGENSSIVSKQAIEILKKNITGECWVHSIPDCGHSLLTERPAYLADILKEFFDFRESDFSQNHWKG